MKQFHLTTCVWGDWHIELMSKIMMPTLLSNENLPALAKMFDVSYRISTTNKDKPLVKQMIESLRLDRYCKTEIIIDTEEDNPDHIHHVDWYHKAITLAKENNALCAFLPPDVA